MQKYIFAIFYIIISFTLFSCIWDAIADRGEEVSFINETGDEVTIYHITAYNQTNRLLDLYEYEQKYEKVTPGIEYFAIGRISKKKYGSRIFIKVPPDEDMQVWIISNFVQ